MLLLLHLLDGLPTASAFHLSVSTIVNMWLKIPVVDWDIAAHFVIWAPKHQTVEKRWQKWDVYWLKWPFAFRASFFVMAYTFLDIHRFLFVVWVNPRTDTGLAKGWVASHGSTSYRLPNDLKTDGTYAKPTNLHIRWSSYALVKITISLVMMGLLRISSWDSNDSSRPFILYFTEDQ